MLIRSVEMRQKQIEIIFNLQKSITDEQILKIGK